MNYIFSVLWTAMELGYGLLFFRSFFELKRQKEDTRWFLAAEWLIAAVFICILSNVAVTWLIRLLALVLMLLYLFRESGQKGLAAVLAAFALLLLVDRLCAYAVSASDGAAYYLSLSLGKALSVFFAWALGRYLAAAARKRDSQELDLLFLRQRMELQTESIQALERNYRLQRKNTHEFEHHLQVLRDLLDRGETTAARDYLARLQGSRALHVISVNSRHPVIDVILDQKYQTAQENDIKMQIRVNDLSAVSIPTDSLVVVLTNLLDNAIEACRRIDGYREICCNVLYDEGLYLAIRNTSEKVESTNGQLLTSKPDASNHGYGLGSVSYMLDTMEAEYTYGYEDGWFQFVAEIPI